MLEETAVAEGAVRLDFNHCIFCL